MPSREKAFLIILRLQFRLIITWKFEYEAIYFYTLITDDAGIFLLHERKKMENFLPKILFTITIKGIQYHFISTTWMDIQFQCWIINIHIFFIICFISHIHLHRWWRRRGRKLVLKISYRLLLFAVRRLANNLSI